LVYFVVAICFLLSDWYEELSPQEKPAHKDEPPIKLEEISTSTDVPCAT
jgi:hypothetical protein